MSLRRVNPRATLYADVPRKSRQRTAAYPVHVPHIECRDNRARRTSLGGDQERARLAHDSPSTPAPASQQHEHPNSAKNQRAERRQTSRPPTATINRPSSAGAQTDENAGVSSGGTIGSRSARPNRRLGLRFGVTPEVVSQPLLEQFDGREEVVVEAHQQVDVVDVAAATEAVGQVGAGVDRAAEFSAAGTEEAEVALELFRWRRPAGRA